MAKAAAPARHNEEFDHPYFPDAPPQFADDQDPPPQDESDQPAGNGEPGRRRRSPLERAIAGLLRARENVGPEDLAREVESRFKELAEMRTDYARKDVVAERTVAYNEVLKKKVKALKRQLLELALAVDED